LNTENTEKEDYLIGPVFFLRVLCSSSMFSV